MFAPKWKLQIVNFCSLAIWGIRAGETFDFNLRLFCKFEQNLHSRQFKIFVALSPLCEHLPTNNLLIGDLRTHSARQSSSARRFVRFANWRELRVFSFLICSLKIQQ
jgi:hypothetical protein